MAYVSRTKRLYFSVFLCTVLIVGAIALFVIYVMPKHAALTFKDVELDVMQVEKGEPMPELPEPTLYGHNFNGWYYSRNFNETQKVNIGVDIVESNLDLYPYFTPASFNIQFNPGEGTGLGTSYTDQVYNTSFMFPNLTQAGISNGDKVLVGWTTSEDGSGTVYKPGDITSVPGEDVTFYAVWDFPKTTVYFVTGEGAAYKPSYTGYSGEPLPRDHQLEPVGGLTGYKFGGWYENEDFTGSPVDFGTWTLHGESVSLYAKWNPEIYTVTFVINSEIYTTKDVAFGTKLVKPEDPEIPGYDFLGWFLQVNFMSPYNFDSLATKAYKDLVLYGKIAENKTEVENVTPAEAFETQPAGANTDEVIIKGITTNYKNSTSLIIPRFYNGKTVVGITADVCNLSQLVEVSIPHTIRTIDERAFSQCPKLTEFKLQTSSEYFAVDGGVLYSITDGEKSLLRYPAAKTALEYATLTDTKAILSNAFEGVSTLKILTINAQEIESYAFEGATSIIDITLGNGVTTVADDAFLNYYALEEMTTNYAYIEVADGAIYSAGKTKLIKFFGKGSNINYVTPNTVETICAYAFRECSNIVSIELGPNCVNVGIGAMRNCTGLVTVTIRGNADATNTIDHEFIRNCNAITTIYLNMTSTNKFYTILQASDYADKLQQLP